MATTNPCSGCGTEVPARRPSKSGEHWCKAPGCQRTKQRMLRARRRENVTETREADQLAYVAFAIHAPRVPCPHCGLADAVNGYVHRNQEGGPCRGVGTLGATVGLPLIDVVHPNRDPSARVETDQAPES